eukprot:Rhum_TRINITY_DN14503_c19_g1::Rhum_TRINITY_DN14503_c19_g1_i1::g.95759::m.95759
MLLVEVEVRMGGGGGVFVPPSPLSISPLFLARSSVDEGVVKTRGHDARDVPLEAGEVCLQWHRLVAGVAEAKLAAVPVAPDVDAVGAVHHGVLAARQHLQHVLVAEAHHGLRRVDVRRVRVVVAAVRVHPELLVRALSEGVHTVLAAHHRVEPRADARHSPPVEERHLLRHVLVLLVSETKLSELVAAHHVQPVAAQHHRVLHAARHVLHLLAVEERHLRRRVAVGVVPRPQLPVLVPAEGEERPVRHHGRVVAAARHRRHALPGQTRHRRRDEAVLVVPQTQLPVLAAAEGVDGVRAHHNRVVLAARHRLRHLALEERHLRRHLRREAVAETKLSVAALAEGEHGGVGQHNDAVVRAAHDHVDAETVQIRHLHGRELRLEILCVADAQLPLEVPAEPDHLRLLREHAVDRVHTRPVVAVVVLRPATPRSGRAQRPAGGPGAACGERRVGVVVPTVAAAVAAVAGGRVVLGVHHLVAVVRVLPVRGGGLLLLLLLLVALAELRPPEQEEQQQAAEDAEDDEQDGPPLQARGVVAVGRGNDVASLHGADEENVGVAPHLCDVRLVLQRFDPLLAHEVVFADELEHAGGRLRALQHIGTAGKRRVDGRVELRVQHVLDRRLARVVPRPAVRVDVPACEDAAPGARHVLRVVLARSVQVDRAHDRPQHLREREVLRDGALEAEHPPLGGAGAGHLRGRRGRCDAVLHLCPPRHEGVVVGVVTGARAVEVEVGVDVRVVVFADLAVRVPDGPVAAGARVLRGGHEAPLALIDVSGARRHGAADHRLAVLRRVVRHARADVVVDDVDVWVGARLPAAHWGHILALVANANGACANLRGSVGAGADEIAGAVAAGVRVVARLVGRAQVQPAVIAVGRLTRGPSEAVLARAHEVAQKRVVSVETGLIIAARVSLALVVARGRLADSRRRVGRGARAHEILHVGCGVDLRVVETDLPRAAGGGIGQALVAHRHLAHRPHVDCEGAGAPPVVLELVSRERVRVEAALQPGHARGAAGTRGALVVAQAADGLRRARRGAAAEPVAADRCARVDARLHPADVVLAGVAGVGALAHHRRAPRRRGHRGAVAAGRALAHPAVHPRQAQVLADLVGCRADRRLRGVQALVHHHHNALRHTLEHGCAHHLRARHTATVPIVRGRGLVVHARLAHLRAHLRVRNDVALAAGRVRARGDAGNLGSSCAHAAARPVAELRPLHVLVCAGLASVLAHRVGGTALINVFAVSNCGDVRTGVLGANADPVALDGRVRVRVRARLRGRRRRARGSVGVTLVENTLRNFVLQNNTSVHCPVALGTLALSLAASSVAAAVPVVTRRVVIIVTELADSTADIARTLVSTPLALGRALVQTTGGHSLRRLPRKRGQTRTLPVVGSHSVRVTAPLVGHRRSWRCGLTVARADARCALTSGRILTLTGCWVDGDPSMAHAFERLRLVRHRLALCLLGGADFPVSDTTLQQTGGGAALGHSVALVRLALTPPVTERRLLRVEVHAVLSCGVADTLVLKVGAFVVGAVGQRVHAVRVAGQTLAGPVVGPVDVRVRAGLTGPAAELLENVALAARREDALNGLHRRGVALLGGLAGALADPVAQGVVAGVRILAGLPHLVADVARVRTRLPGARVADLHALVVRAVGGRLHPRATLSVGAHTHPVTGHRASLVHARLPGALADGERAAVGHAFVALAHGGFVPLRLAHRRVEALAEVLRATRDVGAVLVAGEACLSVRQAAVDVRARGRLQRGGGGGVVRADARPRAARRLVVVDTVLAHRRARVAGTRRAVGNALVDLAAGGTPDPLACVRRDAHTLVPNAVVEAVLVVAAVHVGAGARHLAGRRTLRPGGRGASETLAQAAPVPQAGRSLVWVLAELPVLRAEIAASDVGAGRAHLAALVDHVAGREAALLRGRARVRACALARVRVGVDKEGRVVEAPRLHGAGRHVVARVGVDAVALVVGYRVGARCRASCQLRRRRVEAEALPV